MPDLSYISKTMMYFYIAKNQIVDCGSLCQNKFSQLKLFSVGSNNITYMDIGKKLPLWPIVTNIMINNNQLTSLPDLGQSSKGGNTNQIWLTAHDNPYHCNQAMAWLAQSWVDLHDNKVVFGRVMVWTSVLDEMRCQTPDLMEGFPIWQLGKTVWALFYQTRSRLKPKF